ncbi:transglutaminase-like domain-containing protein [Acetivibrio clariflavus]|uniref:Transglutaminase-like enzyme, predicted cysteine protease n=1 Tax=Acetivibrio clariflavus (strain DSM 19732 / NBRC 101661 / EBR45) TaxID=720554 RepID=G8LWN6_ACECE|nr:transglutaminase domain-containing protein [Acetivibrio clariflavus]AEV68704.1 transglutaminase-like enzyme, predicted cysteine protease [Acetivibrio clariflavus DSM 19732]
MNIKKSIKIISMFIIIAFCLTFGLPLQQVVALETVVENKLAVETGIPFERPETVTNLGAFADLMSTHINNMKECLENNDQAQFKKELKNAISSLEKIKEDISKELLENKSILDKLNATIAKARFESFKREIDAKINTFTTLFKDLESIANNEKLDEGNIEDLKIKLDEIEKQVSQEQPAQPLGNSLPHQNASIKPEEPIIGNEPSSTSVVKSRSAVYEVLPSTSVEEDLAETPETVLSEKAKKLADTFNTPVEIYEYVRNNIDFEPYYGSRKGAVGTFNQLSGNDYDQASLLIAMLRYKGIPARYVKGTIELPIDQAMEWTGAQDADAAVKVLGALGNPTVAVVSGGKIVAVRTEHVWVEAYLPYKSYNRLGVGKGNRIWMPLDPSFKQYEVVEGLDFNEIAGVTVEQIKEAFTLDADRSEDGDVIKNVNFDKMDSFLEEVTKKIEKYVSENNLDDSYLKDLLKGKKIEPENLGVLQLSLPYKVVTTIAKTNKIYDTDSEKIGFSISGNDLFDLSYGGSNQFNVEFKAVELYGKRITLLWVPATAEDKSIIDSYGGLYKTPTYMIQLKPQLIVDGRVVAEGSAVGFANKQQFKITMKHVGRPAEEITNTVIAGGIYSVSLDLGKIDGEELDIIKERIEKVKDIATENNIYTDEVMGEILNSVGKAYFAQLDAINSVIARAMNVSAVRQVSEAMTGYQPDVKYMFGVPVEVSGGYFYIDVDHDVAGVTSLDNNRENEVAYMLNSGIVGSSMEHVIHEQIFKVPSVSAIKIISEANSRGIPVYAISKDNIDKINELNVSSNVKADIRNSVNSGKIVIIPQEEIRYYDWYGTGYIVMDPETGSAGYMISGGIAGGSIGKTVIVTLIGIATLILGIIDVITLVGAIMAATNPLLLILYFALYAVSLYAVFDTINSIIMYWETGDFKYAKKLAVDLFVELATMGLFKIIKKFAPAIENLFEGLFKQMDKVIEFEAKHGKEITEAIIRISGEEALEHADELIDALKRSGIADDVVEKFAKRGGLNALKELAEFQAKHGNDILEAIVKLNGEGALKHADELIDGLKRSGLGDDLVENIAKHGGTEALQEVAEILPRLKELGATDEVIDVIARAEGVKALDTLENLLYRGFNSSDIVTLSKYGIQTTDYAAKGITYSKVAENVSRMLNSPADYVDLYRAVGPDEFYDIINTNRFNVVEHAYSGKQFGFSFDEILELTDSLPESAAIFKARIPKDVFVKLDFTPLDTFTLKSGSLTVPGDLLEIFNNNLIDLQHVF